MRFDPPRPRSDEERILPLINIVFLLLIFFMVAGKLAATDPLDIDPPQSALESEAGPRELLVLLDAEGRLALDGEIMVESELKSALQQRLAEDGTRIRLKADGRVEATRVVALMELLQDAGAEKVKLLTVAEGG
ncbi:MAG: biopolymer transporter ExbD [Porticoccaceae bacterium]|nr:biopolymer transporter ExbD [Porticoccaceae bacterium]